MEASRIALRERIVERVVGELFGAGGGAVALSASWREHSHDVGRIELSDGRVLMVKLGRFEWAAERFAAEREAARLLRRRGIAAPEHLDVSPFIGSTPVLCYWRLPDETLATLWPALEAGARSRALRSWGALLRRIHGVSQDGFGRLGESAVRAGSLRSFLERDLGERLAPAVAGTWPGGVEPLEAALAQLPRLERGLRPARSVLLHGDPNARNVLCRSEAGRARCGGVIDLESAMAGPAELDLAHARVLHGPLFSQPLPGGWFEELRAGYGGSLDGFALRWFALYHLLNLGFFSAHIGDDWHAHAVAREAAAAARGLRRRSGGTAPAAHRLGRASG